MTQADDLARAKAEMRKHMRAVREAIPAETRKAAARRIAGLGFSRRLGRKPVVVSSYWPIGTELHTGFLERSVRLDGHAVCLPCMQDPAEPLVFRLYRPGDSLRERKMGIMEPIDHADEAEPDFMLIPLLAFDSRGWRLGYGGGYYDRSIAKLRARKTVVAIGLAFDEQKVDDVPHGPNDQSLDWMLTPSGVVRCAES